MNKKGLFTAKIPRDEKTLAALEKKKESLANAKPKEYKLNETTRRNIYLKRCKVFDAIEAGHNTAKKISDQNPDVKYSTIMSMIPVLMDKGILIKSKKRTYSLNINNIKRDDDGSWIY